MCVSEPAAIHTLPAAKRPATKPARANVLAKSAKALANTAVQTALFDDTALFGDPAARITRRLRYRLTATDLFCGAGGVTAGFAKARVQGVNIVKVLQAVNHDLLAIASHKANHRRTRHFLEDITKFDAAKLVRTAILWASLECTNFSNAKGGQSRDADSRSLAEHMERYIRSVRPLYFLVENVREFMAWGPLYHKKHKVTGLPVFRSVKVKASRLTRDLKPIISKKTGRAVEFHVKDERGVGLWRQDPVMVPESRTKGKDFMRWKGEIEALGYDCHFRLLNSADFGERTSRVRLFMIFSQKGLPVRWPKATHSNPRKKGGLTVGTEPWLPVRPCLELERKGRSIFNRTRINKQGEEVPAPLVEKTLKRLFAGLCQYIAGSDVPTVTKQLRLLEEALKSGRSGGSRAPAPQAETEWLSKRTSNPPSGKANPGASLGGPGPAVACGFQPDLVQVEGTGEPQATEFLTKAFTGDPKHLVQSVQAPSGAITCVDHHGLGQVVPVSAEPQGTEFLTMRHHTDPESRGRTLEQPALGVLPKDHHELAQVVSAPAVAVAGEPEPAPREFLTNPGWPERCGGAPASGPSPTLIARQDKAPMALVQAVDVPPATGETAVVLKYYSSGKNVSSPNDPSGALTCTDRMALGQVEPVAPAPALPAGEVAWLDKRFGSGEHNHQSVNGPSGAILTNDHNGLAQTVPVRDTGWLVNTNFTNAGTGLDQSGPTFTASRHHPYVAQTVAAEAAPVAGEGEWLMDNKFGNVGRPLTDSGPTLLTGSHHYLAQTDAAAANEPVNWQFQDDDCETMRLIRLFLRAYNLADVLLRMLFVSELLRIQGFPNDYILLGSNTDKKKFVGNSVPPKMSQRLTETLYEALLEGGYEELLSQFPGSAISRKPQPEPSQEAHPLAA